jgi:hypothetical protein
VPAWTIIDEQRPHAVELDDGLHLDPAVLGWERKPQGLCRGELCIPVAKDGPLDLHQIAEVLGRPLAVDADERVAALAASPSDRGEAMRSGLAPDFELPDLDGRTHRLSDHRGRKVVLYAYASW